MLKYIVKIIGLLTKQTWGTIFEWFVDFGSGNRFGMRFHRKYCESIAKSVTTRRWIFGIQFGQEGRKKARRVVFTYRNVVIICNTFAYIRFRASDISAKNCHLNSSTVFLERNYLVRRSASQTSFRHSGNCQK